MKQKRSASSLVRNIVLLVLVILGIVCLMSQSGAAAEPVPEAVAEEAPPAWFWPVVLFGFAFVIGVIAPISGVGGGVLFVPLATALLPFSVDFVRGTGLVMALVSAQSSAPHLIKKGLANLRIMAPLVIVSIVFSILGSLLGLWLTNAIPTGEYYVIIALGLLLLGVFVLMVKSKKVHYPEIEEAGPFAETMELNGEWYEHDRESTVQYKTTRFRMAALCFAGVGFLGGMFGVGAGWANVPVLNLVMGAPLKVATATSMSIISVNGAAAVWVYLAKGAILPLMVLPSVIGITVGARIGARISHKAKPVFAEYLVMGILLLAAILDIFKGLRGLEVF
ncbi:MAG: sulfite exporter TauE/SafE family protein [Planctomycetes bacterium]|nr:sulfite exporter TauE/SafE family protein [Planctomycetota bacterium]